MLMLMAQLHATEKGGSRLRAAARELIVQTRKEQGCLHYALYEDTEKRGRYLLIEQWEDRTALEKHWTMSYVQQFQEVTRGLMTGEGATIHEISSSNHL
jgi:quinol monooxygenase YgiN